MEVGLSQGAHQLKTPEKPKGKAALKSKNGGPLLALETHSHSVKIDVYNIIQHLPDFQEPFMDTRNVAVAAHVI